MKFIRLVVVENIGHMVTLEPGESPWYEQEFYGPSDYLEDLALSFTEPIGPIFYAQEPTAEVLISHLNAEIAQDSMMVMAEVVEESNG